jgi:hypothetical protein
MPMDKSAPDYSNYTLEELKGVRENIDGKKYPKRLEIVEQLLSQKVRDGEIDNDELTFDEKVSIGFSVGEIMILVSVCLLAALGYSFF